MSEEKETVIISGLPKSYLQYHGYWKNTPLFYSPNILWIYCLHFKIKTPLVITYIAQDMNKLYHYMCDFNIRFSSSICQRSSALTGDPDNKVHGANMGPTWVLSAPDGPHVGPMNLAIRGVLFEWPWHSAMSEWAKSTMPADWWWCQPPWWSSITADYFHCNKSIYFWTKNTKPVCTKALNIQNTHML